MCALRDADFATVLPLNLEHFHRALQHTTSSRLLYAAEAAP
jgi:hypothetical protein